MADSSRDTDGTFCYFSRDLAKGSFGADVSCLQQYLKHEGHLADPPSGYFGAATEVAVIQWQEENNVVLDKGVFKISSRSLYAKKNKLPTAEQLRARHAKAEESPNKSYLEVCLKVQDGEVCQSRCITKSTSSDDRMHSCQDACQMATSEACDKLFPASQPENYSNCQGLVVKNCRFTCSRAFEDKK